MTATNAGTAAQFQSTHPVKGATPTIETCGALVLCFNPRTREGATPKSTAQPATLRFQSTHP